MLRRIITLHALLLVLLLLLLPASVASAVLTQDDLQDSATVEGAVDSVGPTSEWVQWIEDILPASFVYNSFLTIKVWQWIGLGAFILLGLILDLFLRVFLKALTRKVMKRKGGEAKDETLSKTVRPFGLFAAGSFWLLVLPVLEMPQGAAAILLAAAKLFVTLAGVWSAYRVTDLLSEFFTSKAAKTDTKIDDLLIPLLRKTAKIFITVFGLIYIAEALDIQIGPLLAGLGIGGIGFAFAARDTLENFFGSITVIVDRPFQIGDWVQIGDTEGTVEEIGFRSTRVRTFYNSLITIPNGNLVRAVVDNFGKRKYRRWKTHLSLTYDTHPDKIEAFCEGIRELIRVHPYTRKDYFHVWLHQFGPSSLDVLVYMFHETPDWQTELRERHRLMLDIIRLADRLGVQFAFPTQTLHMYKESHEELHTPAPVPESDTERKSLRDGQQTVRELISNAQWRQQKPGAHLINGKPTMADDDGDDEETQIESKVGGA